MESTTSKFKTFFLKEKRLHEDNKGRIDSIIDSNNHILFFKAGKDIFGAGEESRVVFARMRTPDEDMPKNWEEEASFSATNLTKAIRGETAQQSFHQKDLKKIKVIDREDAVKQLMKIAEKQGGISEKKPWGGMTLDLSKIFQHDPDDAPNFVRADED